MCQRCDRDELNAQILKPLIAASEKMPWKKWAEPWCHVDEHDSSGCGIDPPEFRLQVLPRGRLEQQPSRRQLAGADQDESEEITVAIGSSSVRPVRMPGGPCCELQRHPPGSSGPEHMSELVVPEVALGLPSRAPDSRKELEHFRVGVIKEGRTSYLCRSRDLAQDHCGCSFPSRIPG